MQRERAAIELEAKLRRAVDSRERGALEEAVAEIRVFEQEGTVQFLKGIADRAQHILGIMQEEEQGKLELQKAEEEAQAEGAGPLKQLRAKLEKVHYKLQKEHLRNEAKKDMMDHTSVSPKRNTAGVGAASPSPVSSAPAPLPMASSLADAAHYASEQVARQHVHARSIRNSRSETAARVAALHNERKMLQSIPPQRLQDYRGAPTRDAAAYSPLEAMRSRLDMLHLEERTEAHSRIGASRGSAVPPHISRNYYPAYRY